MTGLKKPNVKQMMLFAGRAYPELAAEVAALMNVEIVPTRAISAAACADRSSNTATQSPVDLVRAAASRSSCPSAHPRP